MIHLDVTLNSVMSSRDFTGDSAAAVAAAAA
jgi:hypothetical protein